MSRQKLSTLNVGNLLVVLGVAWLCSGFWLPYATADRVYRIEKRATRYAAAFRDEARKRVTLQWNDTALRDELVARVNAACGLEDPGGSLYLRVAPLPTRQHEHCFCYQAKHYYYLILATPRRPSDDEVDIRPPGAAPRKHGAPRPGKPDTPPAIEVYAWPKDLEQGGRTVFFFPTDAKPAFTRNLDGRYSGLSHAPQAGMGRFEVTTQYTKNDYRGVDDERWVYLPR